MHKTIALILTLTSISKQTDVKQQIKELEIQKNEVLNQINHAIGDSVKALTKIGNDSNTIMALNYMKDLEKQVKEINKNESETAIEDVLKNVSGINLNRSQFDNEMKNSTDLRRFYGSVYSSYNKNLKINIDDIMKILNKKNELSDETKSKTDHTLIVQKKLEDWILARKKALEKKQISRIRNRNMEKCPNFGVRIKKKSKYRRAGAGDVGDVETRRKGKNKKNKRKKNSDVFPCCRKCCKESYMGCL